MEPRQSNDRLAALERSVGASARRVEAIGWWVVRAAIPWVVLLALMGVISPLLAGPAAVVFGLRWVMSNTSDPSAGTIGAVVAALQHGHEGDVATPGDYLSPDELVNDDSDGSDLSAA